MRGLVVTPIIMPIDKDEWEKGRKKDTLRREDTLEAKIKRILDNNKTKAYSSSDITNIFYKPKSKSIPNFAKGVSIYLAVDSALKKLENNGLVKSKVIEQSDGTDMYYTAN